MKRIPVFSLLVSLACLFSVQCGSLTESDSGGSGADFDPSLYYTKTDIDAKLAAIAQPLQFADTLVQPITGLGYANGTPVWTIPTGYSGVVFQIVASSTAVGEDRTINVHFADGTYTWGNGQNWSTKVVIPPGESIQVPGIVSINTGPTNVKAWLDSSSSSAWDSSYTVSVAPLYWIRH